MAGKICIARGRLPGDYRPLINQSERAYYRSHIMISDNDYVYYIKAKFARVLMTFSKLVPSFCVGNPPSAGLVLPFSVVANNKIP